ncbi:unnamed protein product, partial [Pylaiella littoralis]
LTFPRPGDKRDGLVVLLRQPRARPVHVGDKLEGFRQRKERSDGQIIAKCTFWGGVPPGFVERLLTRCCHLGTCDPFWRFGVLIQSVEHFSVILEYEEDEGTLEGDTLVGKLSLEVYGDCTAAEPWAAMSACLSVFVRMLSEFPGVDANATMDCQNDDHSEKGGILIALSQPQEWAPLIRNVDGCRSCLDDANDEARLRLRYMPVAGSPLDIKRFRSECGKAAFPVLAAREAKERAAAERKRIADEAEAKRVADEAEAKRVADEAEAKRVADEAEAKRAADEAEAKRVADEAEAKRAADEAEAKRAADEAEAKRAADEAEAKRAADEAEAKRAADEAEVKRAADEAEAMRVADEAEAKRVADEAAAALEAEEQEEK